MSPEVAIALRQCSRRTSRPWTVRASAAWCVACVGLLLSGCGQVESRLETVYRDFDAVDMSQPPLVVVHGMFGSELGATKTGQGAWAKSAAAGGVPVPGQVAGDNAGTASLGATDLVQGRSVNALHPSLFRALRDVAGFRRAEAGQRPPPGSQPYYVFVYDWRQDSVIIARQFDQFLGRIREGHGSAGLKVDILAHGTGGLIVRYFLRYGSDDVIDDNDFPVTGDGARFVRRVVLMGTPNLGATEMLRLATTGQGPDGWQFGATEVLGMPSVFQFLPHPIANALRNEDGSATGLDHFDVKQWQRHRWGIFDTPGDRSEHRGNLAAADHEAALARHAGTLRRNLERGRRFIWSLTVEADELPTRLVVFGGACDKTPAKVVLEAEGDRLALRFSPRELRRRRSGVDYDLLFYEPGDGHVTKSSLLARQTLDPTVRRHRYSYFPLHYAFFLCAAHRQLTEDYDFQNNLLHILLSSSWP